MRKRSSLEAKNKIVRSALGAKRKAIEDIRNQTVDLVDRAYVRKKNELVNKAMAEATAYRLRLSSSSNVFLDALLEE